MPNDFISLAEETGLMPRLGNSLLLEACRRAARWHGLGFEPIPVSVNVSVRQLQAGDFPEVVERVLLLANLPASRLTLEITESIAATGAALMPHLARLRDIGVRLSIDDFGTGYSSFSYLLKHRIDTIKIDRSFVSGLPHDSDNAVIVKAIVSMARNLGLGVVAEGVETAEQVDFLRESGCEVGQGFLFGKPVPWRELETLLPEGRLPIHADESQSPLKLVKAVKAAEG
jgi:EAL domain-containing protein (putative c-di-GMP-specific phosphodiesterase class I)